jgi:hypothetical protein
MSLVAFDKQCCNLNCYLKSTSFWRITPCVSLNVNLRFGETLRLHLQSRGIRQARNQRENRLKAEARFAYSSTLKMETMCSSKMSVDFQLITRRYIPEENTLDYNRCESFKSDINLYFPGS